MEKFELDTPKGASDVPPEKKIRQNEIVDKLKKIFELFGFNPLETPILERYDVLASKYAGGAEILKETFKLKDQGDRDLCLRYDLTVPFCRFVGMNKALKMPFKRYEIGPVFRDGPITTGRTRKFWQCDFDVVGVKSMLAEAECIEVLRKVFSELGIDIIIKINNRKIINGILRTCNLERNEDQLTAILAIDKLEKIGKEGVRKELLEKGLEKYSEKITEIISFKGSTAEKIEYLAKIMKDDEGFQGLNEIKELFDYVGSNKTEFDLSLARGLAYYTGTVFEVVLSENFSKKLNFRSSLLGGGRYDNLIGNFLQSSQEYPAVGASFGLVPIMYVLEELRKEKANKKGEEEKEKKTVVQLFVIPIGKQKECLEISNKIREQGVNIEMDLMDRGVSKNLNYANTLGIPFVLFVGEEELKKKKFKIKNMETGEEKFVSIENIKNEVER